MQVILDWDGSALLFIQEFIRQDWLDPIVKFLTHLGDAGFLWIVLAVALLISRRQRQAGAAAAISLLIGFVVTNLILKNAVMRPRPYDVVEGLRALVTDPSWSFPSGHATSSFAAATALYMKARPRWEGACALAVAALISLSRLYVGIHYPTDVLCGALIGIAAAGCAVFLMGRVPWGRGSRNTKQKEGN